MLDKPLFWVGSVLRDIREFPAAARREAGYELRRVQRGLMPTDSKPVTTAGSGVFEIRIHGEGEHRVVYVAKYREGVYVLHAFQKRSRKTRRTDVETIRCRLADVRRHRRSFSWE